MADLLNNILSQTTSQLPQTYAANVQIDLNTDNKIKPLHGKGRLLPSRIIGSPVEYVKDLGKDIVSIKNGAKGKANDHELGRMNDLAMKAGSLALAAYLFVKNPLKLSKTMEFVGFGSFFASMALWPKLFIQAPLKARTGIDIHQKYEDSFGRKKTLLQDPQYFPSDLVPQDYLDKIADKNGIPKDIPNRNEVTTRMIQKTGVQGNTLWMMTAGFATPLMSALSCSAAEKAIGKVQAQHALKSTETKMGDLLAKLSNNIAPEQLNLDNYAVTNKSAQKQLQNFFANLSDDAKVTPKLLKELTDILNIDSTSVMSDSIGKELSSLLKPAEQKVDGSFIKNLFNNNPVIFKKNKISFEAVQELIAKKGPDFKVGKEGISELAQEIAKLAGGGSLSDIKVKKIQTQIASALNTGIETASAPNIKSLEKPASKILSLLDNFQSQRKVIDQYVDTRVGDKSGTFIANQWAKVNDTFFKAIGITDKDLAKAKAGGQETIDLVSKKLTALAKDETKYKAAMEKLTKAVAEYDETLNPKTFVNTAANAMDSVINQSAKEFKAHGFNNIVDSLIGKNFEQGLQSAVDGSLKSTSRYFMEERVMGARASFYRMIQTMDLFKKLEDGTFESQVKMLQGQIEGADFEGVQKAFSKFVKSMDAMNNPGKANWLLTNIKKPLTDDKAIKDLYALFDKELKEVPAEVAKQVKDAATQYVDGKLKLGKNAQFESIFEIFQNNPKLKEGFTKEAIEKCKKTLLEYKITDHTEKLNNVGYRTYNGIMNLLYQTDLDEATSSVINSKSKTLMEGLESYRKEFVNKIGNWQYWYKPNHTVTGLTNSLDGTRRHCLIGSTIQDMVKKHADGAFNTNVWLKRFGGMALGLVGVTLIAQQFFGKMKKEEVYAGEQK